MQSASLQDGPITVTTNPFQWGGGNTNFTVVGDFASAATVALEQRASDGGWVTINTKTANAITSGIQLSPGEYRILITGTTTGIWYRLNRVPI